MTSIAILGELDLSRETQRATVRAIEDTARFLGLSVFSEWISTRDIPGDLFARYHAIWVAPGCRYLDQDRLFRAIRHAREHGVPCFGNCAGFQHMILEYARNELGFSDAQSEEYAPEGRQLFISALSCPVRGREIRLEFTPESLAERLYGSSSAMECYYCSLGVNQDFLETLRSGKMKITGSDADGAVRVIEWPDHPFFLETLYVPQVMSMAGRPHPLVKGFLCAANRAAKEAAIVPVHRPA